MKLSSFKYNAQSLSKVCGCMGEITQLQQERMNLISHWSLFSKFSLDLAAMLIVFLLLLLMFCLVCCFVVFLQSIVFTTDIHGPRQNFYLGFLYILITVLPLSCATPFDLSALVSKLKSIFKSFKLCNLTCVTLSLFSCVTLKLHK